MADHQLSETLIIGLAETFLTMQEYMITHGEAPDDDIKAYIVDECLGITMEEFLFLRKNMSEDDSERLHFLIRERTNVDGDFERNGEPQ